MPVPFTPGGEGAGEVVAVGPGVASLRPGDRVAYVTGPPHGSYAEHAVVPAATAARLPEGLGYELAAAALMQVGRKARKEGDSGGGGLQWPPGRQARMALM